MPVPTLTDPIPNTTVASGLIATNNAQLRAVLAGGIDDANLSALTGSKISGLVAYLPTNVVSATNTDLGWGGGNSVNVFLSVSTGGGTLRSIGAPAKGSGVRLIVRNFSAAAITLKHQLAGGTGAKLYIKGSADLLLAIGESIEFVYDGTNWAEVGRNVGTTASYGTSLPGSPADGQEYVLVDSTTNPNWSLRFRYNAGSANTDKWEYMGGTPITAEVTTDESTASTTYAALTTAGPSIVIPRAGVWLISLGYDVTTPLNDASVQYMSYDIGGTGAVDADAVKAQDQGTWALGDTKAGLPRQKTLGAVTLTAKYRNSTASTKHFANRRMMAVPIRVS